MGFWATRETKFIRKNKPKILHLLTIIAEQGHTKHVSEVSGSTSQNDVDIGTLVRQTAFFEVHTQYSHHNTFFDT